jgi:alpha-beta hydrolase superfamily lysophospholipase
LRTAKHHGVIPLLVLTAGKDHTIDLASQEEFIGRLKEIRDVKHFHYPECFHSLLIEQERDMVIADILKWIGQIMNS